VVTIQDLIAPVTLFHVNKAEIVSIVLREETQIVSYPIRISLLVLEHTEILETDPLGKEQSPSFDHTQSS
jgi:hypothetical protein